MTNSANGSDITSTFDPSIIDIDAIAIEFETLAKRRSRKPPARQKR
jgi:hypothetical protein